MTKVSGWVSIVVLVAQMGAAQKKTSILEGWIAAWNSHDAEVIAIFTTNVLMRMLPSAPKITGLKSCASSLHLFFEAVPDVKFELVNSSIDRGHGRIEWIFSGTDRGLYKTGKRFSVRGISAIDLHGGKISRNLDYYDAASIMKQVGLLPCEKSSTK